ncbi:MAG: phosphatase PAP2 family protein [Actinomycetes bacterium]
MLAALLLIVAVGLLWLVAVTAGDAPGDRRIDAWAQRLFYDWRVDGPRDGAAVLTWLVDSLKAIGDPLPAALLTLGAVAAVALRMGPRYGLLLLSAATVGLATTAMKIVAPRPGVADGTPSFPSGHTAYATAVLGTAAALAIERGHRRTAAAACAAIFLMGATRVIGGGHWLSDVLAGYALGGAWLLLILAFGMPWARRGGDGVKE